MEVACSSLYVTIIALFALAFFLVPYVFVRLQRRTWLEKINCTIWKLHFLVCESVAVTVKVVREIPMQMCNVALRG